MKKQSSAKRPLRGDTLILRAVRESLRRERTGTASRRTPFREEELQDRPILFRMRKATNYFDPWKRKKKIKEPGGGGNSSEKIRKGRQGGNPLLASAGEADREAGKLDQ